MKRIIQLILSLFLFLTLTGCWDLNLLRDARMAVIVGLDRTPEGKLLSTSVIREVKITEGGEEATNLILKSTGHTPRETQDNGDRRLNNRYDISKNRVILLGEKLAREDIYPVLDILYRDPKSALNAHIAVTKGRAEHLLDLDTAGDTLIGEYVDELINSAEEKTLVPIENVQSICPVLFDPGQDFAIPYITIEKGDLQAAGIDNEKDVSVEGIAMFHGHHMTGTLNREESRLFLMMADKLNKTSRLTIQVDPGKSDDIDSYITIDMGTLKRKLDIRFNPKGEIHVDLNLDMNVEVVEYPDDKLAESTVLHRLDKKLSESITHQSEQVIKKMKRSRFDGFGIGREIMAHSPEEWHGAKWWTKTYPKVKFHPKVNVHIVGHGIIS
ncbi:Ger(x)C family spore germination protein [Melghirimyces algeriensis]|uniref:Germination protein, Ger(X)C family n=1 Tax=Melghirimyces algeriensis TaxID=910412 RepID=A0A521DF76_9BACL|nr:Ger(x)C family spore germination protein [Melghirimyces algeriensis]SMO70343.1 germination protein, Ger(x)C family [Melghirimyces algeriensis]